MLPFVAGIVVGAAAVVAYNNKKEFKEAVDKGLDKTKDMANDIKQTASSTVECVKQKVEESKKAKKEEDGD